MLACVAALASLGCASGSNSKLLPFGGNEVADPFESGAGREPSPQTLYLMSRVMIRKGRYQDGEGLLLELISKEPKFTAAYGDLAELRMRQGRLPQAKQVLWDGLTQGGEDPKLRNNLGMCLLEQGEYRLALEQFEMASSTAPRSPLYRGNLALALGLNGRYEESLAVYRQFLPEEAALQNIEIIQEGDKNRRAASAGPNLPSFLSPK